MRSKRPGGKAGAARSDGYKEDDDTVTLSQTADPDKDAPRCRGCGVHAGALVRACDAGHRPRRLAPVQALRGGAAPQGPRAPRGASNRHKGGCA